MLSTSLSQPEPRLYTAIGGGLHVPARAGVTRWFFGDTYSIKLTSQLTNGSLGLIEASVPPGGGPAAHTHAHEDEIWYLISGELEFLSGDQTFNAGPRDVVFIPRTVRHRFRNLGVDYVKTLFLFTPGGPENTFIEGGDEPKPGAIRAAVGTRAPREAGRPHGQVRHRGAPRGVTAPATRPEEPLHGKPPDIPRLRAHLDDDCLARCGYPQRHCAQS